MGSGRLRQVAQTTDEQRRQLALHQGQLSGVTILIEGFLMMPWYRRLWWVVSGRFDRQWAVREVRAAYERHQQELRDHQAAASRPTDH